MIWLVWMTVCLVFLGLAYRAGDSSGGRSLAFILCGLLLMRIWPLLPESLIWVAAAATWALAAICVMRVSTSGRIDAASVLLFGVSVCMLWGKLAGYGYGVWEPHSIVSNVLGALAIALAGGSGIARLVADQSDFGDRDRRGSIYFPWRPH